MIAVFAAMFAFASCTPEEGTDKPGPNPGPTGGKLATPVLTETHTATSFTVAWEAVTNADSYLVNLNGKNYPTAECSYTFENLNAGEYEVRVKAKGAGYDDSDLAKIVVTLTGLTEVDWFTQKLYLLDEPYQFEDGSVVYPHNSLVFEWKGTGVADIQFALFPTSALEDANDGDIKANLGGLGDKLNAMLQLVNGDGYMGIYGDLSGSTSYTLCTLVKNAEGVECLVKSVATTAEAIASDAAKAWLGNWTAYVDQQYIYDTGLVDQRVDLNLTIEMLEGETDVVLVYGYSVLGANYPVFGYIYEGEDGENVLGIMNQSIIGQQDQLYYTWISYGDFIGGQYDGTQDFMLGEFPAFWLIMSADGNSAEAQSNTIQWNSNGDQFKAVALGCGGWDGENGLAFFQDENGAALPFYSCDVKGIQRSSAAASKASVRNANEFTLTPSIVVSNVYSL